MKIKAKTLIMCVTVMSDVIAFVVVQPSRNKRAINS